MDNEVERLIDIIRYINRSRDASEQGLWRELQYIHSEVEKLKQAVADIKKVVPQVDSGLIMSVLKEKEQQKKSTEKKNVIK